MEWKDYYKILQVDPSAEQEVIKAAYNRLSRKYHPDVNKGPAANERMKDINEAFETLGDPEKRKRYHSKWLPKRGMSGAGAGASAPSRPKPTVDEEVAVSVPSKGAATPLQVGRRGFPDWAKWIIGLVILGIILAIVISVMWSPPSPAPTPSLPPTEQAPTPSPTPNPPPESATSPPAILLSSGAESVSISQQVCTTPEGKGTLSVGLRYDDGKPMVNWVYVYTQKKDVVGNWVADSQVTNKQTDNAGRVIFNLTPGNYALKIDGLIGHNWGNMVNEIGQAEVPVKMGYCTDVTVILGSLTLQMTYADGKPIVNWDIEVWPQKLDVTGKWVQGMQGSSKQTDNNGITRFDLTPGQYALIIHDGIGYPWGNPFGDGGKFNVVVRSGEATVKRVDTGRLTVGVTASKGEAARDVLVSVSIQKKDSAGNWIQDGRTYGKQTDSSGFVSFDLPPGQYAIRFRLPSANEDRYIYNITVNGGEVTSVVE